MDELTKSETGIATSQQALQEFTSILNEKPDPKTVQKHQGYEYLPISFVEKELDKCFSGLVQYECISYQQIFNEISAHARIKVFHPIIGQWLNYDGLGSAVIQQDKDTKVSDFMLYKKANALQLTMPKAFAEAIKNAAKKIGKRFGSDINRKFEDEYSAMDIGQEIKDRQDAKLPLSDEMHAQIALADTVEILSAIYNDNKQFHTNPDFMKTLTKRRKEIESGK